MTTHYCQLDEFEISINHRNGDLQDVILQVSFIHETFFDEVYAISVDAAEFTHLDEPIGPYYMELIMDQLHRLENEVFNAYVEQERRRAA